MRCCGSFRNILFISLGMRACKTQSTNMSDLNEEAYKFSHCYNRQDRIKKYFGKMTQIIRYNPNKDVTITVIFCLQSSQLAELLWTDPGIKEWSWCARPNLRFCNNINNNNNNKKKKKALAGNEWSNILPKSSQARKKPPPPPVLPIRFS